MDIVVQADIVGQNPAQELTCEGAGCRESQAYPTTGSSGVGRQGASGQAPKSQSRAPQKTV